MAFSSPRVPRLADTERSDRPPYFASTPCTLGSLRAEAGARLSMALCPPTTPRFNKPSPLQGACVGHRGTASIQPPRPLNGDQFRSGVAVAGALVAKLPESARSRIQSDTGWSADLVAAAGVGVRGLVPRGTLFERFMTCPVEPTRNGTYQFCVVGLDTTSPGHPRYMAWEPTGYFDRWFAVEEIELRLALQRAGRSVGGVPTKEAKEPASVIRWPEPSDPHRALVHNGLLPDLDVSGRPMLPPGCRHQARTSIDLLGPLLYEWKRRFLPSLRLRAPARSRLLAFDDTGRLAQFLQESLDDFDIVATHDRSNPGGQRRSLGSLRTKARFEVQEDAMSTAPPALLEAGAAFDVVLAPFLLHRLCWSQERLLLSLWRECLRCAASHVLIAEDISGPASEEAWTRWKAVLQGDWSSTILLEGSLSGAEVKDHFLSNSSGPVERRYLIVDASAFHDRREARGGGPPPTLRKSVTTLH